MSSVDELVSLTEADLSDHRQGLELLICRPPPRICAPDRHPNARLATWPAELFLRVAARLDAEPALDRHSPVVDNCSGCVDCDPGDFRAENLCSPSPVFGRTTMSVCITWCPRALPTYVGPAQTPHGRCFGAMLGMASARVRGEDDELFVVFLVVAASDRHDADQQQRQFQLTTNIPGRDDASKYVFILCMQPRHKGSDDG